MYAFAKPDSSSGAVPQPAAFLCDLPVNANVDPKTVQALARHSDVRTTLQSYAQSSPEKGLAAQGKMLEAMGMVN